MEEEKEIEGTLPVDLYQKGNNFVLLVPLAGVSPDDVDIQVTEQSITIEGERKREEKTKEDNYFYQECFWGKFKKTIKLPLPVDIEKTQAEIKNGLLKVVLPRLSTKKEKKIKINYKV